MSINAIVEKRYFSEPVDSICIYTILSVCLYVSGSSSAHRQDGPHVYYTKITV